MWFKKRGVVENPSILKSPKYRVGEWVEYIALTHAFDGTILTIKGSRKPMTLVTG